MLQSSGNILLYRDDLGKTKSGVHVLPDSRFVYGKVSGGDKEGAGDLMRHWEFHTASKKMTNEKNFKLLNSMSAMNGLSTATEFRTFRKGKDVRLRSGNPKSFRERAEHGFTYGMPCRTATPIKAVISNFYGRVSLASQHEAYEDRTPSKLSKWSSTRGFELLKQAKKISLESKKSDSNLFKMKKFSGVRPKTDCWRPKPASLQSN